MLSKIHALADMAKLRGLRLWHWQQALRMGALYRTGGPNRFDAFKAQTLHIQAVQALNDLFPVDDTAERDNNSDWIKQS